ncbi:hypothetical protein OWR29_31355 [Actinoplanes sp. Pm04-4]|uniref:Uncharacterized protein n=1 Tax=Paractinoplanes pyxinae TaxID=2997416 RepID=A0ABT4B7N3_9ACTN|nr:hypothetical protein [Actinoplanes pyxinae]MCY1142517.1 hypothetical protein [Actinoplanes pyxinae]
MTTSPAEPVPAAATEVTEEPAAPADEAPPAEEAAPAEATATAPPTTDIVAGQGGVMTDEVGVVTGELTLRTELDGFDATVRVQYKDADEWYTVTGAKAPLHDPKDADAIHAVAVGILNRPDEG